ncbi:MAG: RBBP9/YdeN family alpha/beta hydrolase [Armatimonadota bacterium]
MSKKTVLVLHGWGGNKPEHWQEHLAANPPDGVEIVAPKFPNPGHPDPGTWIPLMEETFEGLAGVADSLTVVAHSLGAITWLHVAARAKRRIADRVLLVAPPYVVPGIPPWSAPPGVDAFFPPPLDADAVARAAREVHLVGGNDDDYATWEQMETYAKRLGIEATCLQGAGHISPYWGYGRWEWVERWCAGEAELPPLPNA